MSVPLWAILGIVLIGLGLPLLSATPLAAYGIGAGGGFLIVGVSQIVWNSTTRDVDLDNEAARDTDGT